MEAPAGRTKQGSAISLPAAGRAGQGPGRGRGGGPKTPEEWWAFRDEIIESLLGPDSPAALGHPSGGPGESSPPAQSNPPTKFEWKLAERIAGILWRLDRVNRYEAGVIYKQALYAGDPREIQRAITEGESGTVSERAANRAADIAITLLPTGSHFERILRFESHYHRMLIQTMQELESLQRRRKGEHVNLARISVVTPPRGASSQTTVPEWLQQANDVVDRHDRGAP